MFSNVRMMVTEYGDLSWCDHWWWQCSHDHLSLPTLLSWTKKNLVSRTSFFTQFHNTDCCNILTSSNIVFYFACSPPSYSLKSTWYCWKNSLKIDQIYIERSISPSDEEENIQYRNFLGLGHKNWVIYRQNFSVHFTIYLAYCSNITDCCCLREEA